MPPRRATGPVRGRGRPARQNVGQPEQQVPEGQGGPAMPDDQPPQADISNAELRQALHTLAQVVRAPVIRQGAGRQDAPGSVCS